ncbi:MAG: response regulator transcription factor [Anaerolineae bacterium]|nr:response regulator transcription factor [Anaerolineae bacterium]
MVKGKLRILVVDDEPQYVWTIQVNLEARGYAVLTASSGREALDLAVSQSPDLIVLDIRLPDMDGFQVCRQVRTYSTVPILMLTALAEDRNKIKGLDLGADDYITKPFGIDELMARIRSVFRRVEFSSQQAPAPVFQAGNLEVDLVQEQVFVEGKLVHLTRTEYRLLCELIKHAGKILSFDDLLQRVWGEGTEGQAHLVRQVVHRLRAKIEPDRQDPQYIQTYAGLGYFFALPDT